MCIKHYFKILFHLLVGSIMLLLYNPPSSYGQQPYRALLKEMTSQVSYIQIANINCNLPCNDERKPFYCDNIAFDSSGVAAKTLEKPLKILRRNEAGQLIALLNNDESYSDTPKVKIGKKWFTTVLGKCNCFPRPTVAFIFRNEDSAICGQILMDINTGDFLLYYFKNGTYIKGIDAHTDFISFYPYLSGPIYKMAKKYKLSCIEKYYETKDIKPLGKTSK